MLVQDQIKIPTIAVIGSRPIVLKSSNSNHESKKGEYNVLLDPRTSLLEKQPIDVLGTIAPFPPNCKSQGSGLLVQDQSKITAISDTESQPIMLKSRKSECSYKREIQNAYLVQKLTLPKKCRVRNSPESLVLRNLKEVNFKRKMMEFSPEIIISASIPLLPGEEA
jgi:hypothetical protein